MYVELVLSEIGRVDGRTASAARISPDLLGAREGDDIARHGHCLRRKNGVKVEWCAMGFAACHAVAYADAIGVAAGFDRHLPAGAGTLQPLLSHARLRCQTNRLCSTAASMNDLNSGCGSNGRDFSSG